MSERFLRRRPRSPAIVTVEPKPGLDPKQTDSK